MKKILIFSLAYGPRFWGGAEVAVHEITKRIAPEDVSFDMITLRFDSSLPRMESMGNVRVHRIGFATKNPDVKDLSSFPLSLNKYLFPFLAFFKAALLHRKRRYDATWAIMANYAGFAALFFKFFYPRVPFLLTLQEGDPIPYIKRRVRFVMPLFERIFKKADVVQAISNHLAWFGREAGARGLVRVIPNGVDTHTFGPQMEETELKNLREELGLKENDKVLITASRLVPKNAIEDVIESLTFLPPEVKFLIAGIGPLENALKKKTAEAGLAERVFFLGHVEHGELPRYFAISDVFVRPSLSEGLGNAFIEAMAAGLPVIATPVGGIIDFLKHEETGLFCEVRNPRTIAKASARLFADAILREKITANARRLAASRYNWDSIARDFKENVFCAV